jgi:hypothetical protein
LAQKKRGIGKFLNNQVLCCGHAFYALALTGIPAFFHTKSLSPDLLFAYSSKK